MSRKNIRIKLIGVILLILSMTIQSVYASSNKSVAKKLSPQLSKEFVTWWLQGAFDCSEECADVNHEEASHWMDPSASVRFRQIFWKIKRPMRIQPHSIEQGVLSDSKNATVRVEAIILSIGKNQDPFHNLDIDFKVRLDEPGIRIESFDIKDDTKGKAVKNYIQNVPVQVVIDPDANPREFTIAACDLKLQLSPDDRLAAGIKQYLMMQYKIKDHKETTPTPTENPFGTLDQNNLDPVDEGEQPRPF